MNAPTMMGRTVSANRSGRTYQLMEIGMQPSAPAITGLDGRSFIPGFYVSTVDELPASRNRDGRVRVHGYYAVFWPMDDEHENDESSAMYFGPFASERDADGFVRRMSTGGERL